MIPGSGAPIRSSQPTSFGSPASPRTAAWLLAVLVIWSLALRVAFASYDPGPGRFYDERFNLENLRTLVVEHRLRPANGWYPSLGYLPQVPLATAGEALSRLTGNPDLAFFDGDRYTPTAYRVCRWSVAVFGALTLVLTFLIGRRLFDPTVGLASALLLSATPAHLRLSVVYKPDMLLALMTTGVFLFTLSVARRPTTGRWLAAGATVGLAAASKLTGVLTALPLVVVATVGTVRQRSLRPLLSLTVAGLAAAASFLALNPHLGILLDYMGRVVRVYGERAELAGLDRIDAFRGAAAHLVSSGFHGPWIGALSATGLVGLAALAWSRRHRGWTEDGSLHGGPAAGLIPLFVLGYGLAYAATTAYPKPNNLLPVLPFTALAAGWVLVTAARGLFRALERRRPRWHRRALPWAGSTLAAALVLALQGPLAVYAYHTAVPTTAELVTRVLARELRPYAGRLVVVQGTSPPGLLTRRDAVAMWQVDDRLELRAGERRRTDAEVYLARGGNDLPADSAGPRTLRFEPRFGRAWGPARVLVLHPWKRLGQRRHWAEAIEESAIAAPVIRRWTLPLPDELSDPSVLSVQVLMREGEAPASPPRLRVGGRSVPLHDTRLETGGYMYGTAYTSIRFPRAPGEEVTVDLTLLPGSARPPVADVLWWQPPPLY